MSGASRADGAEEGAQKPGDDEVLALVRELAAEIKAQSAEIADLKAKSKTQEPIGGERVGLERQDGAEYLRLWDTLNPSNYHIGATGKFKFQDFKIRWKKDDVDDPLAFEDFISDFFQFLRRYTSDDLDSIPRDDVLGCLVHQMPERLSVTKAAKMAVKEINQLTYGTREALKQVINVILQDRHVGFEKTRSIARKELRELKMGTDERPSNLIKRMDSLARVTQSSAALGNRVYLTEQMILEKFPRDLLTMIDTRRESLTEHERPPLSMLCLKIGTITKSHDCPSVCLINQSRTCGVIWYDQLFLAMKSLQATIRPVGNNSGTTPREPKGKKKWQQKGTGATKVNLNAIRVEEQARTDARKVLHEKYGHGGLNPEQPKKALDGEKAAKEVQVLSFVAGVCRGCLRPMTKTPAEGKCQGTWKCNVCKESPGWGAFRQAV